MPAKAGIQLPGQAIVSTKLDSRLRGNDNFIFLWISLYAAMLK